jgi:hypothetical protein
MNLSSSFALFESPLVTILIAYVRMVAWRNAACESNADGEITDDVSSTSAGS